jgi:tetratricopeptide (TPR) repeat protein
MAMKLKDFFSRKTGTLQASAHQPSADEWFQRGVAHVSQQQWQPALDAFGEAVRVDPAHAGAHACIGNVLRELRDPDAALRAYDRALAVKPDFAEAHYNRAVALHQTKQAGAALESYEAALSLNPSLTQAHCGRGEALRELGRLDAALASFDAAIAADGGNARAHAERGVTLMALGDLPAAIASFDVAVQIKPDSARVFANRALAQAKLGLLAEARMSHDQAVLLDPDDAAIQFSRGVFLSELRDAEGAVAGYRAAIALRPDYADAYCNLGLVQQEAGDWDAAIESYSRALAIDPRLATAYNNRGNVFRSKKRFAEAMRDFRQALALAPDFADVHFNIGQMALLLGDLTAGWQEYEWRPLIKEALTLPARNLPQPPWLGDGPLSDRRIFLYPEQGLGDTIQFCRYVRMVAALGAHVVLEVQPSLGGLLADLEGVSQLIRSGEPIPPVDYQCSLMSLPAAFKTTMATIPCQVPYLRADPIKVARWHEILGPRTRPRIGLSWSGNPHQSNDHNRSMPLARWLPYLSDEFEYVCLHNAIRDADRQTLRAGARIKTVESYLEDFTDTAALIDALDLVISVDTSLAHLSGAMGKKTWILLCFLPDWRWLLDRSDNPWYPTATLYRQPTAGDWDGVLAEVSRDLRGYA